MNGRLVLELPGCDRVTPFKVWTGLGRDSSAFMDAIAWTLDASILSHHSRSGMVKSH
ncbi:MAG TPA: hypothetical protein V6D20_07585 [Candidatus Obscuribacterales bacterium]